MLIRCARANGQRMHRTVKFFGQNIHHTALAFEPRRALKRLRHDNDPKMRFAFGTRTSMTGVQKGLVSDFKIVRRNGGLQFFFDLAGDIPNFLSLFLCFFVFCC